MLIKKARDERTFHGILDKFILGNLERENYQPDADELWPFLKSLSFRFNKTHSTQQNS